LWDSASGEDKQGLAGSLFEYVVYDLDARRFTDFYLKPWADRYLVLRAALYENEDGAETRTVTEENDPLNGQTVLCPHRDSEPQCGSGLDRIAVATARVLQLLYCSPTPPETTLTTQERNRRIRELYAAGETLMALAERFGISFQRVHQIVHHRRK
jgi:hypothetical protein